MHNEDTNSIKKIRETFWSDILGIPYSNKDSFRIGEGGNACVYKMTKQNGEQVVLKELKSGFCDSNNNKIKFAEKIQRFQDEILTMQNLKSEQGVMPIFDYSLEGLYYTMPIAIPIMDYLKPMYEESPNQKEKESIDGIEYDQTKYVRKVVDCILSLVNSLIDIHSKGYAHRDIKPDNLYQCDNEFVFGDFGLVDFPEKMNITLKSATIIQYTIKGRFMSR